MLNRLYIGHTRLTYGLLMTRNDQQPECTNAACGNQTLTIKNYLVECPQWRDTRKKYNIHSDMKTQLRWDCEVEKIMKFIKETNFFKK